MPNFCDIVTKPYISNYQSFYILRNSLKVAAFGAEHRRPVTCEEEGEPCICS
jgi:hypothetical protein